MENDIQKSLRKAIRDDDVSAFFKLLDQNPNQLHANGVFGTWMHFAASHGRLTIIRRLVALGCDPNTIGGVHHGGALHLAASDGHYDVVKYLLEVGAMMDTSEPERNPLFGAIHGGHTAIAKLLIDSKIDTSVKYTGESMKNMDATAFAQEWGRVDIVNLLRSGGNR